MKTWHIVGASVQGTSHQQNDIPCQDAHGYRVLLNGAVVIAVAGGTGTANRSHDGAQRAVEQALDSLERDLVYNVPRTEFAWQRLMTDAFRQAREAIVRHARWEDASLRDFAATLTCAVASDEGLAVGQIGDRLAVYERKLTWMLAHPPDDPTAHQGHASFAWPLDMLYDEQGSFVGYLMSYVQNAVTALRIFNPRLRVQTLPNFDRRYLHRTAQNLAAAVEALHARDYVIGDLHESNVMVTSSALVTLIDTDSFQVEAEGEFYPCIVGKPEYTPPELQGKSF